MDAWDAQSARACGDGRINCTSWLPFHHALEQLRLLLVGPRFVEQLLLRRRARVLGCLGLHIGERRRSGAGFCFLARRHREAIVVGEEQAGCWERCAAKLRSKVQVESARVARRAESLASYLPRPLQHRCCMRNSRQWTTMASYMMPLRPTVCGSRRPSLKTLRPLKRRYLRPYSSMVGPVACRVHASKHAD